MDLPWIRDGFAMNVYGLDLLDLHGYAMVSHSICMDLHGLAVDLQ